MKITFISDTHTQHSKLTDDLVGGDVLIHAGDIMGSGYDINELKGFSNWLKREVKPKYKDIIIIAGNHDRVFDNYNNLMAEQLIRSAGATYLNDSGCIIKGVRFWGSPIQPAFFDWAFNRARSPESARNQFDRHNFGKPPIKPHWDLIPNNTDVLITHGPPYGILDLCKDGSRVGCKLLKEKVKEIKPKVHVFGHIHESYGQEEDNNTLYINASNLDHKYRYKHKPININLGENHLHCVP